MTSFIDKKESRNKNRVGSMADRNRPGSDLSKVLEGKDKLIPRTRYLILIGLRSGLARGGRAGMKGACHFLEGNPLILLEADLKNPGFPSVDSSIRAENALF